MAAHPDLVRVLEVLEREVRRACARRVYAMRLDHRGLSPEARLAKRVLAVAAKELAPITPGLALTVLTGLAADGDAAAMEILSAVRQAAQPTTTEKE